MPQNQNVILPTIGRKLWFFPVMDPSHPNHQAYFSRFDEQPLDATVIYVHQQQPDQPYQLVNLSVIDHAGLVTGQHDVPLVQPGDDIPADEAYATWMPYQVAQSTVGAASAKPNPDTPPLPPAVDPVAPSAPTPLQAVLMPNSGLTFGDAIVALKTGKKVSRAGWNGKGMWLALTPASTVMRQDIKPGHALSEIAAEFPDQQVFRICSHVDMRAADGSLVVGWLASQTDVLAEDWQIVE